MNDLITTTELLLVQSALPGILGFPVLTLVVAVSICDSPHMCAAITPTFDSSIEARLRITVFVSSIHQMLMLALPLLTSGEDY
jgi:hypothetical protein